MWKWLFCLLNIPQYEMHSLFTAAFFFVCELRKHLSKYCQRYFVFCYFFFLLQTILNVGTSHVCIQNECKHFEFCYWQFLLIYAKHFSSAATSYDAATLQTRIGSKESLKLMLKCWKWIVINLGTLHRLQSIYLNGKYFWLLLFLALKRIGHQFGESEDYDRGYTNDDSVTLWLRFHFFWNSRFSSMKGAIFFFIFVNKRTKISYCMWFSINQNLGPKNDQLNNHPK